jgi:hypothetical protein
MSRQTCRYREDETQVKKRESDGENTTGPETHKRKEIEKQRESAWKDFI